jgi:hypothetical protein
MWDGSVYGPQPALSDLAAERIIKPADAGYTPLGVFTAEIVFRVLPRSAPLEAQLDLIVGQSFAGRFFHRFRCHV